VLIYQIAQNVGRFGFTDAFSAPVVGEYADVTAWQSVTHLMFWFYRCFLAIQLSACADVTAWQSVTHLTFWFCQCILAIQLSAVADVTAWQSVTHLAFVNTFWRSVQTFLVLLHTEAGGTPAFQSDCRFAAIVVGCADIGRFGFADVFWRSSCRLSPT
jgi:hypothetical protein